MTAVHLQIEGDPALEPRRVTGRERLGEAATFELDLGGSKDAPVTPASVLRKPARLTIEADTGRRTIAGIVTRFVVIASDHPARRAYRMTVRSRFALLELRRRSRIFQRLAAPDIVEQVVKEGGYATVTRRLQGAYPERRYVVQYEETDAAFVRRLCEEHGLWFRTEPTDDGEAFVLEDTSSDAEEPYADGIGLVSRSTLAEPHPVAVDAARARRRRPGKVTLRDHNPDKPDVKLEGTASGGGDPAEEVEVYEAPGGFSTPGEAGARARLRLEALRADASLLSFRTNALALAPGSAVSLVEAADYRAIQRAGGDYVAIGVETRWELEAGAIHADVEAIPRAVPYRLPRVTPRPRIAGVQSAYVSGEGGQEIHPDELGRVHLRFHWDVHGETDHQSSLPVRVAQPHSPGALIVPRVGWEVFAMFDDGDPDRPYVIGRSYNARQPPPLPLPANKTVTSIASDSSPGAGARTVIQMDDAAGREHMLFNAPFAKDKKVGGKLTAQTKKNENEQIGANLTFSVGSSETISVHLAWMAGYGSRGVNVGAAQYQSAGGNFVTHVGGSEVVVVAGLVGEQVGNPVRGAANLAFSAALAGIGSRGLPGAIVAAGLGVGRAAAEGYMAGGQAGAERAAAQGAAGVAMSFIPGGEAIMASVTGSSKPMPWDHGRPPAGDAAPGGGASAASGGDAGPAGPGPGHRTTAVSSSYTEVVAGVYSVATPGSISWVTAGAANVLINGSHTTTAPKVGVQVAGGMAESLGSLNLGSDGVIAKKVLGLMRSTVSGALNVSAGTEYKMVAKASLTLKVTGTLEIVGDPVTFKCGASEISATSGGLKISAPSIKITGSSKQSGSLTHK